ncbi:MAG: SurA N-terminal domain-containing protein [Verrucomicrobiota bacterium]
MIGTIRRHQQWLWIIIILAIIVSFVVYFSPTGKGVFEKGDSYNFGSIKNRPITRDEFQRAQNEIEIFYFLRFGKWLTREDAVQTGFDLDRESYNRLLLIEKLKELNVQPTTEATAKWIGEIFRGGTDQAFPMERYQAFVKTELTPHNLNAEDFSRFATHQVGQQHLISVYGLGGKMITPQEAESFYRRLNEPLSTEAVFFPATNYLSGVSVTPTALGQFYTNNMAEYRLPDRVQVNYVKWEFTNYLAEADKELGKITNLSQRLEQIYFQRGTNTYKDEQGKPLSIEAAKAKIKEDERQVIAGFTARKKASEFLTDLFQGHDEKNPFSPEDLEKMAKAKGLEMKTTPTFDQINGAKQLKVSPAFVQTAFRLRNDDPEDKAKELLYPSAPVFSEDAVYVIGFSKRFPSENQSFEKVSDRVTADYRADESLKLARQTGVAFASSLTNSAAAGKSFADLATQSKVNLVTLPAFSLSTRSLPELGDGRSLETLQNVASSLAPGQTSSFMPTTDGGLVLHLKSKLPVDEAKLKTELPEFLARQREQRMSAAFSEWFQKLPEEMKLVVPAKTSGGKS